MNARAYDTYKEQGVLTASSVDLVVMLYDEAIKQLKLGGLCIERKDFEQTNLHFQKAKRIIMELINSLDFHYEISNDLLKLYEFFLHQIGVMNANKDNSELSRLTDILTELRQTWSNVARMYRSGRPEP